SKHTVNIKRKTRLQIMFSYVIGKNVGRLLCVSQKRKLSTEVSSFGNITNEKGKKYKPRFRFPTSYRRSGSVYVHWPYCRRRCSYCNFVKFIPRPGDEWTLENNTIEDAMVQEVKTQLLQSHINNVSSVFFGGGTPTLARPQLVEKILVHPVCQLKKASQIVIAGSKGQQKILRLKNKSQLMGYAASISLQAQALDDNSLKLLNRDHAVNESLECLNLARFLFPGKVSIDLIFGRPKQTVCGWEKELEEAMNICDNHISLYQLTVERGTELHRQIKSGNLTLPDEEMMADMYELAVTVLEAEGLRRYEVSNFARNYSAQSIHNKSYWEGSQYVGVGPGAHGRILPITCKPFIHEINSNKSINGRIRYNHRGNNKEDKLSPHFSYNDDIIREARINAADPLSWLMEVQKKGTGVRKSIQQTHLDIMSEFLTSGLRMTEGISAKRWAIFSPNKSTVDIFKSASWLEENNLIKISSDSLKATKKGLNVLDSILPHLINCLKDHY
ncbi:unnamed protein product, partial [Meganyctiphanes norvegica]